jgi:hypothetical protein
MPNNSKRTSASKLHSSWLAVTDGRACIGHILHRGKRGIEAFDGDDRSIGIFANQHEAIAGVSPEGMTFLIT